MPNSMHYLLDHATQAWLQAGYFVIAETSGDISGESRILRGKVNQVRAEGGLIPIEADPDREYPEEA